MHFRATDFGLTYYLTRGPKVLEDISVLDLFYSLSILGMSSIRSSEVSFLKNIACNSISKLGLSKCNP